MGFPRIQRREGKAPYKKKSENKILKTLWQPKKKGWLQSNPQEVKFLAGEKEETGKGPETVGIVEGKKAKQRGKGKKATLTLGCPPGSKKFRKICGFEQVKEKSESERPKEGNLVGGKAKITI